MFGQTPQSPFGQPPQQQQVPFGQPPQQQSQPVDGGFGNYLTTERKPFSKYTTKNKKKK